MVCGFHFGALNLDLIPFHWEIMSFGYTLEDNHEEDREQPES